MMITKAFARIELAVVLALALFLAGCGAQQPLQEDASSQQQSQTVNVPQSPQQAVFAAKYSLLAALTVVADYRKLPVCAEGLILCKTSAIEKRLQALSNGAATALDDAEKAVRTSNFGSDALTTITTSATLAVKALTTITDTLKVR